MSTQSVTASCPVRDLSGPRAGDPRVGVSASCPTCSVTSCTNNINSTVDVQEVDVSSFLCLFYALVAVITFNVTFIRSV